MKKKMQKEEGSTKKPKAKDVRIDSAKKINTKSKMENAEETSKKKTKVKPKVEKIEQPQKERKFHKYLWYLIIFSILGLILECVINFIKAKTTDTPFLVTTGPFCIFYGIGAILTILCLQQYKGKKIKLFIIGCILMSAIQYALSFILETIVGARLWNYTWSKFNINGRVCLEYAILWGIITVILIEVLKDFVDKIINLMKGKVSTIVDIILTMLIVVLIMFTIWSAKTYATRAKETLAGQNYISNNTNIEIFQNTVFTNERMEKIFPKLRVNDEYGNTIHLGERDCSIQRNHQKLVEESPSPALNDELRKRMGDTAVAVAKAVNYENAGTVEFLLDKNDNYYFMEVNTRIQVEHGITELVTGVDLIKEQIKIAAGESLGIKQEDVRIHGAAMEIRINAENPEKNFAPNPGTIKNIHIPGGNGVRIDTAVYSGYAIPPFYDSMIMKVMT